MSEKPTSEKKPTSKFKTIILLLTIVLSVGFWYQVLYAPIEDHEGNLVLELTDPQFSNVSKISMELTPSIPNIALILDPTAPTLFNATWRHFYTENRDLTTIDLDITYALEANNTELVFTISDTASSDAFNFYGASFNRINLFEGQITLNPVEMFNLYLNSEFTGVDFFAADVCMENFSVYSQSGHFDAYFENVTINNPAYIHSASGGLDVVFQNVTLNSDFTVTTVSGHQDLIWNQGIAQNIVSQSTSGGIDITLTNFNFQNLDTRTVSGHIDVYTDRVSLNSSFIDSVTGGIEFISTSVSLTSNTFSSTSGHIDIQGYELDMGNSQIITSTAGIDLILRNSNASNFDLSSSSGHIDVEFFDVQAKDITILDYSGGVDTELYSSSLGNLNITHSSGHADVTLYETVVQNIDLRSNSAGTDLDITESELQGNVFVSSSSGHIDADFTNLVFNQSLEISIITATSGSDLEWMQNLNVTQDVSLYFESTTGYIDAEIYTLPGDSVWFSWDVETENENYSIDVMEL